ncbi:hypothetical protein [Sphingobacterium prati]|nr:hypothetical protein [Sphingobacterium prati]NPE47846.1 hypothetical protein [Sphingobacterium prati]
MMERNIQTGAARQHRQDQDSLTALAARKLGWDFADLLGHHNSEHCNLNY